MKTILTAAAAALCLAAPTQALTFTETTDFTNSNTFGLPTPIGTLDAGANSVGGNIQGFCDSFCAQGTDPRDYFEFFVGAGDQLTGLTFSTTGFLQTDLDVIVQLQDSSGAIFLAQTSRSVPVSETFLPPLEAGRYGVQVLGFSAPTTGNFTYDLDWTLALTVESTTAPVPLPAGLPLLLSALGGVALLRRRARQG